MYLITLTDGTTLTVSDEGLDLIHAGVDAGEGCFNDDSPIVIVTDETTGLDVEFDAQDDIAKVEEFYHD